MNYKENFGLRIRMLLTMFTLICTYVVFLAAMAYYQISIELTVVIMAAFAFIQYFFF